MYEGYKELPSEIESFASAHTFGVIYAYLGNKVYNILNDRRDEIYNPVPFDFLFEKTCHGRELPKTVKND